MIRILNLETDSAWIDRLLGRSQLNLEDVNRSVEQIILNVQSLGDVALIEYTKTFDHVTLDDFRVKQETIDQAFQRIDRELLSYLVAAKENIETYHKMQQIDSFRIEKDDGTIIEQIVRPIQNVGIYVPGGTASYPSTVLMNAIPAKIAGVNKMVMITPPSVSGIKDSILVAAKIAGVDEIYTIGGAQGIAALAYGTQQIPKVDKIVGPGNIYVAVAKRMVSGYVGIDMVAGPSEIAILADETGNPEWIAADMMSQAEHDQLSAAILVTTSLSLATSVKEAITKQIETLSRKEIIKSSLSNYGGIIVTDSMSKAIDMINRIAPEHLEIITKYPMIDAKLIVNAGAIFIGSYTPEPVGDYFAGPNHTLPTSGTARFQSALSTLDFIKKTSLVSYSQAALKRDRKAIVGLANEEELTAHAHAINIRF
jgi:histidinol dehydrogenase